MFAFPGVYLGAVSAHKLISEGRGVLLLHTLLSPGMWAFLRGKRRVVELARGPRGSGPAPASAPRLPAAVLGPQECSCSSPSLLPSP